MNQTKMLALKPEGSQHALSSLNGRRRLGLALEASAYPLLLGHSLPASQTKPTYHNVYSTTLVADKNK
jgi:hypothetical protein